MATHSRREAHRAWLFWLPGGVLVDVVEYDEGPVTREHAAARYAADGDMPPAVVEPVPVEALPAIRALIQQAASTERKITREDVANLTTQEA